MVREDATPSPGLTETEVAAAARLLIGRDLSEDEQRSYLERCRTLEQLRDAFFGSHDFRTRVLGSVLPMAKPLDWPQMHVEVDVSEAQLAGMIDRMERNFRFLGETEPHWSVLSADRYRAANIAASEDEFYRSGTYDVDRLRAVAERCGIDLAEFSTCFELGCGLGRTTRWLAEQFPRVIGADISTAHLDLAQQTMARFDKSNVRLLHVNSMASLQAVPPFDVFFSIIVLQHNPPPLMAHLLRTMLGKLKPGGLAYFQVPTYRFDYTFDASAYLASELRLGEPEMHMLPQHVVLGIAHEAGCIPLEVRDDPSGAYDMISNRFLLQKQRQRRSRSDRLGAGRA